MANGLPVDLFTAAAAGFMNFFRTRAPILNLVDTRFNANLRANRGETVAITKVVARDAYDVVPGPNNPAVIDSATELFNITLDQHKGQRYHLTDEERAKLQTFGMHTDQDPLNFMTANISVCAEAVVNAIRADIGANYKNVYNFIGTPGTAPFGTGVEDDQFSDILAYLQLNNAPETDRFGVYTNIAASAIRKIPTFKYADRSSTPLYRETLTLPVTHGITNVEQNVVCTHTNGTLVDDAGEHEGDLLVATSAGATTITIDSTTLVGTVTEGTVFTVAGDTQTYVVTADATAATNQLAFTFSPASKVDWAEDAVVAFKGDASQTYNQSLVFQKQAIVMVSRTLAETRDDAIFVDPMSGLPLKLFSMDGYHLDQTELSTLFGTGILNPEHVVRIAE